MFKTNWIVVCFAYEHSRISGAWLGRGAKFPSLSYRVLLLEMLRYQYLSYNIWKCGQSGSRAVWKMTLMILLHVALSHDVRREIFLRIVVFCSKKAANLAAERYGKRSI